MKETQIGSLGQENPLEKEIATLSSILAWKIPQTEETGGLQCMPSSRGSSQPRDRTCVSYISCLGWRVLCHKHHLGSPQASYTCCYINVQKCDVGPSNQTHLQSLWFGSKEIGGNGTSILQPGVGAKATRFWDWKWGQWRHHGWAVWSQHAGTGSSSLTRTRLQGVSTNFSGNQPRDGLLALPLTLGVRESSLGSHPSSLTYCVTSNMLSNCFMHQFPYLRVEDIGSWHATVHGVAKGQTRLGYWTTRTSLSDGANR